MAEGQQKKEATRDSDAFLKGEKTPAQGGQTGGDLARAIASEDEEKRAIEPDSGPTRVRKADEDKRGTGNLGTQNR